MEPSTKITVALQHHSVQFCLSEGMITIICISNDISTKGVGKFTNDIIKQVSNELFETVNDLMEYIINSQKQKEVFSITQEGNLKICFKYSIQMKEKIKLILFPLTTQQLDDISGIRLQNAKLRAKIQKLDEQMQNTKKQFGNQIENMKQQFRAQIKNLEQKIENKKSLKLDEIFVRGITFSNGWRIGYYDSYEYFGIYCSADNSNAYWLRQCAGTKYLKIQQ